MAKRSREHRNEIPGYDEARPTRDDRKLKHRAERHATHQILHALDDPDEVVLPEHRRSAKKQPPQPPAGSIPHQPERRRFRVWKTKFWKRRGNYRAEKAAIDSQWPVVTPDQQDPD